MLVSMSVLRHIDVEIAERDAYLRYAVAKRRSAAGENGLEEEETVSEESTEESVPSDVSLSPERLTELESAEEFILTVTRNGYGKRTSAYEYRVTGRGGQGVANIDVSARNGKVAASFPVADADQIMLVTDGGQLIRCPVHDIRIARRQTQGVVIFRVAEDEHVVAVAHLSDLGDDESSEEDSDAPRDDGSAGTTENVLASETANDETGGDTNEGKNG